MKQLLLLTLFTTFLTPFLHAQIKTKQQKGYFNITNVLEPQYLQSIDSSGLEDNATAYVKNLGFAVSTINGIFLNPNVSVGLGLGLQFSKYKGHYPPEASEEHALTLLPIFADFRYYPRNFSNGLSFILDVGYAPLLKIGNEDDKSMLNGGALVKLGSGYKIHVNDLLSFIPSINFQAQRFGENTVIGGTVAFGVMF